MELPVFMLESLPNARPYGRNAQVWRVSYRLDELRAWEKVFDSKVFDGYGTVHR